MGGHAVLTQSLQAAVIVASHAGMTSTIKRTVEKVRVWYLLRVLGPVFCSIFGYMPARRLGLGEDLPAPVMRQWGRWSAMPGYFYDDPDWNARQRAGEITLLVLVMGFDDDPWANSEAIARLMEPVQKAKLNAGKYGVQILDFRPLAICFFSCAMCGKIMACCWPIAGESMPGLNEVWADDPSSSRFNARFWHRADKLPELKVRYERKADARIA